MDHRREFQEKNTGHRDTVEGQAAESSGNAEFDGKSKKFRKQGARERPFTS